MGPRSRPPPAGQPAFVPPLLCDPPVDPRMRLANRSGAFGPPEFGHHPDLHPCQPRTPQKGLSTGPPARLKKPLCNRGKEMQKTLTIQQVEARLDQHLAATFERGDCNI